MKKQIKNDKMKESKKVYKNRKVWRITAIVIVVVFALIIIGGAIKAHYIRSSFIKPTQEQIDLATKAATKKLQSTGANMATFQTQTSKKMRAIHEDNITRIVMQVSFYNNTTTHMYLVDVSSGEVLLHSQTDIYSALENKDNDRENHHIMRGHEEFWYPSGFYGIFGRMK